MNERGLFGPYRPRQWWQEIDRMLSGLTESAAARGVPLPGADRPAVNVWEQGDGWMVELEVPGVKSEDVDISVVGEELTVRGERRAADPRQVMYHRRERPVGTFGRVIRLPDGVDAQRVAADLKNGVLTISLPKAESAKPRKIQVTPR